MKTWETFHNNWKIYVFEISLLNDCTKFVKNYCASDWEILTQSPQDVQILSVLGFDHNSANCSWNRLLSLTYNVTLFAYICVTRDSESTSLREVSLLGWLPVYFVWIQLLYLCWRNNSITCLVKSKPIKQ